MVRTLCIILFFIGSKDLIGQVQQIPTDQKSISMGENLFNDNCSRCHTFGMDKVGPSLSSITDKRTIPWLLSWVTNSQKMAASGDYYAVHLVKAYDNMVMPNFAEISEEDKLDIIAYIQSTSLSDHDFKEDSVNYYDEAIIGKAEQRYTQSQKNEVDYYTQQKIKIPEDQPTILQGKSIFEGQCSSCHQMDKRKTGPALGSVTSRLPIPWLLDWIDNPEKIIESGDDYANLLLSHYPLVMPGFDHLSKEEKLAVLAYIQDESQSELNPSELLKDY